MNEPISPPQTSRIDDRIALLTLCPLIAISDTLIEAAAAALILLIVSCVAAAIFSLIRRWLTWELELPAAFITFALLIAIVELVLLAWAPRLRLSLAVFLPLIVCNFGVLLWWIGKGDSASATLGGTLRLCALAAIALLILGVARELVGHGSLFHGAGTSLSPQLQRLEWTAFDFDMGFLLAMLPPGAFIAFGLLLALRNAWQSR
jgi:electron transport complex protein RnfE